MNKIFQLKIDLNNRNEAWQVSKNDNQYYNDEAEENKVEFIQRDDYSAEISEEQKSVSSAADNEEDLPPRQRSERSYLYQDLEDFELNNNMMRQMDQLNIPSASYGRQRVSLNSSYENQRLIRR